MLGVSGIGPRIALAAIDTLGATGIRTAVAVDDIRTLTAIPGVGRKGAERMALELRGKLGGLPAAGEDDLAGTPLTVPGDTRAEARMALAALGYGAAEIEHALRDVDRGGSAEEMIRQALRGLAS
jgi:Holliday junction DNA helicase RuvA